MTIAVDLGRKATKQTNKQHKVGSFLSPFFGSGPLLEALTFPKIIQKIAIFMSKPEYGLLIKAWAIIKINTVITLSVLSVRPLLASGGYLVYYLNLSV